MYRSHAHRTWTCFSLACIVGISGMVLAPIAMAHSSHPVATVDGHAISAGQLAELEQSSGIRHVGKKQHQALVQALIDRQLLADAAIKLKLNRTQNVRAKLENTRASILSHAALQKYVTEHPITAKELHALYSKQVSQLPTMEYKVTAIVTKTQAQAKAVRVKLMHGAKFAELAHKDSLLGQQRAPGGSLGWHFATNFVPPVAAAIETDKKGKLSDPVWTPKGWWIVRVEGKRRTKYKTFKQARPELKSALLRQRLRTYLKELRQGASISS